MVSPCRIQYPYLENDSDYGWNQRGVCDQFFFTVLRVRKMEVPF